MATLEQKFNMIDSKDVKVRLAHLICSLSHIYNEDGVALQFDGGMKSGNLTQFNSDIASDYKLDEELLSLEIEYLNSLGLLKIVKNESNDNDNHDYIFLKPKAVSIANKYLADNNYPEPSKTYHLYRLDTFNEKANIHIPVVIVVRNNPFSVNQIAPISEHSAKELKLTSNDKKFMNDHFDELNKAITHVLKEQPIAFHLSPTEWKKANEHNPPLVSLIEQINMGYQESLEINERDDIKNKSQYILTEYKAGNNDSINIISDLLENIKQEMRREMRGNNNIIKY